MGRKIPLLILLSWSPLALGCVVLIFMSPPFLAPEGNKLFWSGAFGWGGVIGYILGWRFVTKLSPNCNLSPDEGYGSITVGIAIGMLTCLVMFLLFVFSSNEVARLDSTIQVTVWTLAPFVTGTGL